MNKSVVLLASLAAFVATGANAGPIFTSSSYANDITFKDALSGTTMTVAYDGNNYYSASGGSSGGTRYAKYDGAGNVVLTANSGIDFRSVFTDGSGNVFARGYNSSVIMKQTAVPGSFTNYVTLTGGALDSQSSVVMNSSGQFVAMNYGNVSVWDGSGSFVSSFALNGYSGSYPVNRGIAVMDDYLFTYANQTLSAWDYSGNLLDQTTLIGAGTTSDSNFSLSYANDHVFVVDVAGGNWRGYDVAFTGVVQTPAPATLALFGLGLIGMGFSRKKKSA